MFSEAFLVKAKTIIKYSSKNKKLKSIPKSLRQTNPKTRHILVPKLKVPISYQTITPIAKKRKKQTRIESFNFIF
jgi:hypothetical protein